MIACNECGNGVCKNCIVKIPMLKCPSCRANYAFSINECKPITRVLAKFLSNEEFNCSTCDEVFNQKAYNDHYEVCVMSIAPECKCCNDIKRFKTSKEYETHLRNYCEGILIHCQACDDD